MAYENFSQTVVCATIEKELESLMVFRENTNRNYEGQVKQKGDSVRILGVGKPTITVTQEKNISLSGAETLTDTSVLLPIDQVAYFNFLVDTIDKHEGETGIVDVMTKEASEGMANKMDQFISELAKSKLAVKDSATAQKITVDNVLSILDNAQQKLYENDVAASTSLCAIVSPRFYMILRQAYTKIDTSNSDIVKNGNVGMYGNIAIKISNNVAKTGVTDLIQMKTDRAIAFVNPLTHIENYRPENRFAEAFKGFVLYGAQIVRPKEMVVINAKYTD